MTVPGLSLDARLEPAVSCLALPALLRLLRLAASDFPPFLPPPLRPSAGPDER
jgi:hypothetical protein